MALEVFRCDNCGARIPPPPATQKMVVCEFCKNPRLNPFYVEPAAVAAPAHHAPVAQAPVAQAPVAQAPVAQAPVAHRGVPARGVEEITRIAHTSLMLFDSLFYAPMIPAKKEQGARGAYGAMIPADEPILALYDATVFGGADDGFVITPKRLGWKNIALDPHVLAWELLDASTVRATAEGVQLMGDIIQVDADCELQPRLVQFLRAMGAPAERPATTPATVSGVVPRPAPAPRPAASPLKTSAPKPAPLKGALKPVPIAAAAEEEEEEGEDEEYDAETVQSWIDDATTLAQEHFRRRASLFIGEAVPPEKSRIAHRTHGDEMEEDDTVVALYDPAGGGNDDGFAVTPWGLFWKNRGEEPNVVWWEDLDLDDVVLEDGVLTVEETEVRVADQDRGLSEELYDLIEAMVDWAQD